MTTKLEYYRIPLSYKKRTERNMTDGFKGERVSRHFSFLSIPLFSVQSDMSVVHHGSSVSGRIDTHEKLIQWGVKYLFNNNPICEQPWQHSQRIILSIYWYFLGVLLKAIFQHSIGLCIQSRVNIPVKRSILISILTELRRQHRYITDGVRNVIINFDGY